MDINKGGRPKGLHWVSNLDIATYVQFCLEHYGMKTSKEECLRIVDAVAQTLREAVYRNEVIKVKGLFTFWYTMKKPQPIHNWVTHEYQVLPPRRLIKMNLSRGIKKALKNGN